jgi:hypothetical protein
MSGPFRLHEIKVRYFQEGNGESGDDRHAHMILALPGKSPPSKG